jgi:hypothetical protein
MRLDESPAARLGLDQRPKGVDFADIVNQSEPRTRPLYIHYFSSFNSLRYPRVGVSGQARQPGVDSAWEQKKLEARKMLVNRADSHTSGARFVGHTHRTTDSLTGASHHRLTTV